MADPSTWVPGNPGDLQPWRSRRETSDPSEGDWLNEECIRASGEAECPECGEKYWKHKRVAREVPTLVRACDGRLLKL